MSMSIRNDARSQLAGTVAAARKACGECEHCGGVRQRVTLCRAYGSEELSLAHGDCPLGRWSTPAPGVGAGVQAASGAVIGRPGPGSDAGEPFDRVVCINLDRRPDRWARFQRNLEEAGWPFAPVARVRAVDGSRTPPPRWWRAGAAAWGCLQSHLRVLEEALLDGVGSVLILEDDAVFPAQFASAVRSFLELVPPDWDGLMLGGQHLARPVPHRGVLRVVNGNRTHAHAMRGRYIRAVYQHLCNYPDHAVKPQSHVDHRLGELHKSGRYNVYAPVSWLVGQSEGHSDIAGRTLDERFWNSGGEHDLGEKPAAPVVVLGTYRSGSSCVAGVLHHLGGHGGQAAERATARFNPRGLFEPPWLSRELRALCDEPRLRRIGSRQEIVSTLRQWARDEGHHALKAGRFLYVKHPLLCLLGREMEVAWGTDLRIISVYRRFEDSRNSLDAAGWWRPAGRAGVLERLVADRDRFVADREHLRVDFETLVLEPARVVGEICAFLRLSPPEEAVRAAVSSVDPLLIHHGAPA